MTATVTCTHVCFIRANNNDNHTHTHAPRISDTFLADSVDTTLAIFYSCIRAAMFSQLHDQLASLERYV